MRILFAVAVLMLAACGGGDSFAPLPTRYNFGVVDGANQASVAGASTLGQPITSQLTRHEQGKFAYIKRIALPPFAHAQGLTMPGTPVSGAIVCAREADPGEPKAFPLCAFTDANGKAPITIQGGTKAGTFRVLFTAQVQSQQPVRDSTTVTVEAAAIARGVAKSQGTTIFRCASPAEFPADMALDQYDNAVPYRLVPSGFARAGGDVIGTVAARQLIPESDGTGTVAIVTARGTEVTGSLRVAGNCVSLTF